MVTAAQFVRYIFFTSRCDSVIQRFDQRHRQRRATVRREEFGGDFVAAEITRSKRARKFDAEETRTEDSREKSFLGYASRRRNGGGRVDSVKESKMSYDDVEIEDMEWNDDMQAFTFPCPCGDLFQITKADLKIGEEIARCPSCSLYITVIYDPVDFQDSGPPQTMGPPKGASAIQVS